MKKKKKKIAYIPIRDYCSLPESEIYKICFPVNGLLTRVDYPDVSRVYRGRRASAVPGTIRRDVRPVRRCTYSVSFVDGVFNGGKRRRNKIYIYIYTRLIISRFDRNGSIPLVPRRVCRCLRRHNRRTAAARNCIFFFFITHLNCRACSPIT